MSKVRMFCQNVTGDLQWLSAGSAPVMVRSPRADQNATAATGWFLEPADDGYQIKANTGEYLSVDLDAETVSMSGPSKATTFVFNKQSYEFLDTYNIQVKGESRYLIGRTGGELSPTVALGKTGTKPQAMWTVFEDQRIK